MFRNTYLRDPLGSTVTNVTVGVVFRASGPPVFRCLFCGISRPMFCPWWFRWAVGHNAGHQGELQILRQSDLNSDEIFFAMMGRTR